MFLTYRNFSKIDSSFSRWACVRYTYTSLWCQIKHRWYSLLLGGVNYFPFQVVIHNEQALRDDMRRGSIFITIHSGPYPLAVKAIEPLLSPNQHMIVPCFVTSAKLFYRVFRRGFAKFRVHVVPLGGAMTHVDKALSGNGSVCLFLDARLPVKRSHMVSLFGRKVPMSTGPVYLARRYAKSLVPMYVQFVGNEIHVYRLSPIPYRGVSDAKIMDNIARAVESMIQKTLSQWQPVLGYLLGETNDDSRSIRI